MLSVRPRTGLIRVLSTVVVRKPAQHLFDERAHFSRRRGVSNGSADAICRKVRGSQWNRHREPASIPIHTVDGDRTAMKPRQFLNEANPIPVPSCVRPCEPTTRWKRSNICGNSSA